SQDRDHGLVSSVCSRLASNHGLHGFFIRLTSPFSAACIGALSDSMLGPAPELMLDRRLLGSFS
ncbi:hypothetical protein, partial [Novipirellula herctigrandis]|uniref:hypothetical protein n=1 Tax=Novipirellula herctigrandis TaxID=2527986 RepID=UPI003AF3E29E